MHPFLRGFAAAAAIVSAAPPAGAQDWVVSSLGSLDPSARSDAYGVNDLGTVVGITSPGPPVPEPRERAFVWQNGQMAELPALPGGTYSGAFDVNSVGVAVGYSQSGMEPFYWHAVRWLPPSPQTQNVWTLEDLGTLWRYSVASGINSTGQIVGTTEVGYDHEHAFLWQMGVMTDLGTLDGDFNGTSWATAISDAGHVVGGSGIATTGYSGFIWTVSGGMAALPNLAGFRCFPNAVNDGGQVAGTCFDDIQSRAVMWSATRQITDLGVLSRDSSSEARGINRRGQVAGSSWNSATGVSRAAVWTDLVSAASATVGATAGLVSALPTLGGTVSYAYAINDAGLVAGASALTGNTAWPAAAWSEPFQDVALDFGVYGTWKLGGLDVWQPIHGFSPDALRQDDLVSSRSMVGGDLDGNGLDDLVIDFGPAYGVWLWMNHTTWTELHGYSPTQMMTADLDGNRQDEVILDFPGFGLWRFNNNSTWSPLHGLSAAHLAAGDLDGTGGEELIINFAGAGLWIYGNTTGWALLHGSDVDRIVTADLDGNGMDDVVTQFPGQGLWAYFNRVQWGLLHTYSGATHLAAGDLNGDGRDEVIADFGPPFGLIVRVFANSQVQWILLHALSAEALAVGDLDGSGREDLVVDFGAPGLWLFENNETWRQLHAFSPEAIALGRLH